VRLAGPIDIHVISADDDAHEVLPRPYVGVTWRAPASPPPDGAASGMVGVPLLALLLAPFRDTLGTPGALLLFLLFIVGIAIMGGAVPGSSWPCSPSRWPTGSSSLPCTT